MIIEAILEINPNAKVVVRGSDIDTCEIEWLEETTPISNVDMRTVTAVERRNIGLADDANRNQVRRRVGELGVVTTLPSGRPRPIRDIMSDAVEANRLRQEQRIEEIRNLQPPPIEPVQEEATTDDAPTDTIYTEPE